MVLLHYGWFFQNLGKKAVRTFMHTSVDLLSGGRLMQTIFFYDLGLIKQWEGVDIDEKMEKKKLTTITDEL